MAWSQPPVANKQQRGVMSLRGVLLLFTGILVLALLVASLSVSFYRFRDYVASQLEGHAQDGATAVGLSLSNAIDGRDPVAASSLIDAVFDSGRYLSVVYYNNAGGQVAGRLQALHSIGVPRWFIALADLPRGTGEAEVVRGWSRLGRVVVVSHPGRAYRDLWRASVTLLAGTALIGGLALLILLGLVTRTLRPLREMEAQAEAIGRRDFRRRIRAVGTRDLNRVSGAMNQMADDLGQLFEGQVKLIHHLRRLNNEDSVTGLASHRAFDQRLRVEVETEERAAPGTLVLIQLAGFAAFNQSFGRDAADRLLKQLAGRLQAFVDGHAGSFAGRRLGAEFVVFMPGVVLPDALVWVRRLVEELDGIYSDAAVSLDVAVHAGVAGTAEDMDARGLLAAADEALRQAQAGGGSGCHGADPAQAGHFGIETWRGLISGALDRHEVFLWQQPMIAAADGRELYRQVFSRIRNDGGWIKAGIFVPMAERFGMIAGVDQQAARKALAWLAREPDLSLALSLGSGSVASSEFRQQFLADLDAAGHCRHRLWTGISEQTIHHHRTEVGLLVRALERLGVPVIIDRFGVGGVPFSYLRNLPVRGLRIDHSFIHNIDSHEDNRFYLGQVVGIAHSRGVQVFVTGVETADEWQVLRELGVDGAMGYHLGRPSEAETGAP